MNAQRTNDPVTGILDQMDRHARTARIAILGAAAVEGMLMLIALLKLNWDDGTHVLLFLFSVLGYTIIGLGMVALGAHVSRVGARVVSAIDGRDRR